jgi:hypothetical protein
MGIRASNLPGGATQESPCEVPEGGKLNDLSTTDLMKALEEGEKKDMPATASISRPSSFEEMKKRLGIGTNTVPANATPIPAQNGVDRPQTPANISVLTPERREEVRKALDQIKAKEPEKPEEAQAKADEPAKVEDAKIDNEPHKPNNSSLRYRAMGAQKSRDEHARQRELESRPQASLEAPAKVAENKEAAPAKLNVAKNDVDEPKVPAHVAARQQLASPAPA